MTPDQAHRARQIFEQVSDLPPERRQTFLEDSCSDDPVVRTEVERLLRRETDSTTGVSSQASTRSAGGAVRVLREFIGQYKLVRVIGEGGMGVVYEAEQETPVRRKVAIKVVKHGLDSRQVLSRFDAERQALALMNHPNIERVFDAGADELGRPFFAMELIRGEPITTYCDRHNLPATERLELMIQVCQGVQHAHQKGVIHRDLKPSNVLVEIRDDGPMPRIIDFGVAKAIDRRLTERTLFTEYGQIIGTPEYMSPEQAEMTGLDIDTRTDVYSLGVMLYELLVGALPFDSIELRQAGYDEVRRRIREETPPKPSTRLITLGEASTGIARRRSADPATLIRLCRGDLDWITMKALEKDRTRRYASAAELATDLQRHLDDEPVIAGPPGVGYRMRKFARRYRLAVTVTAVAAAAVLIGLAGTTYGLVRAVRAERQARFEAETVTEFSDFMIGIFDGATDMGDQVTARAALDSASSRILKNMPERPALQGRLLEAMGIVYLSLGLHEEALLLLQDSVERLTLAHGEMNPDVAHALTTLGAVMMRCERTEEALPILNRALVIQDELLDADDLERARTLNNIGSAHLRAGRLTEALSSWERALIIREATLGPDDFAIAKQANNMGAAQRALGDRESAVRSIERAIGIWEKTLGPNHDRVAQGLTDLARVYRETGDMTSARELLVRALTIQEGIQGPEDARVITPLLGLALVEKTDGNLETALELLQRGLLIAERSLDPGHPQARRVIEQLIVVSADLGEMDLAAEYEERLSEFP